MLKNKYSFILFDGNENALLFLGKHPEMVGWVKLFAAFNHEDKEASTVLYLQPQ